LATLTCSNDPAAHTIADFFIALSRRRRDVTRRPNLGAMFAASKTIGPVLRLDAIVS
jgi:hypothetical protein